MISYPFREWNDMVEKSHETLQHFKCNKQHRNLEMPTSINQIALTPDLLLKKEISFFKLYDSLFII